MGVALTSLIEPKEIDIGKLKGKILAVDASNIIYQFLTTIRQRDGSPLTDSQGRITSHLTGLFTRTIKFMQQGMKFVYVFDGKPPELKFKVQEKRKEIKKEAERLLKKAKEEEDDEAIRKYSSRVSYMTSDIVEESKELIQALGLPIVQAPSEGEAQASFMVSEGDCDAVVSQDADCLLFGATKLIRNLSVEGRRKIASKLAYKKVNPDMIVLEDVLNNLGISHKQLVVLGILIGTDYNPGGVKGIGPKTALKMLKKYREDFDKLFENVDWSFDHSWKDVYNLITKMKVTKDYKLEWKKINKEKVMEILCDKHDFNMERIKKQLDKFEDDKQKGLQQWFSS